RAFPAGEDRTCRNWTSSTQGAAMVGHSDRKGLRDDAASRSWNSSHPSRGPDGGCSQNDLRGTGGNGLFYCFAANQLGRSARRCAEGAPRAGEGGERLTRAPALSLSSSSGNVRWTIF